MILYKNIQVKILKIKTNANTPVMAGKVFDDGPIVGPITKGNCQYTLEWDID